MKKGLLTLLTLTLMTVVWGQQLPQCDLLKTASIALCKNDYDLALTTLNQFQKEFPEHALIEEVSQQIGHLYFLKGDYDIAKAELQDIINGQNIGQDNNDYKSLECETSWDTASIHCMKIVFPEPYVHLQHWACLDLYEIFKSDNKLDSALNYLKLADKEYFFNYYCGNGNDMKDIQIALLYRDIYLAKGDTIAAVNQLTKVIFKYESGYQEVRKSLKELLTSMYPSEQLKSEIAQAIESLEKKVIDRNGKPYSWFEIQLFEQSVRIPMTLTYWRKDGELLTIETTEQMQERLKTENFIKELIK